MGVKVAAVAVNGEISRALVSVVDAHLSLQVKSASITLKDVDTGSSARPEAPTAVLVVLIFVLLVEFTRISRGRNSEQWLSASSGRHRRSDYMCCGHGGLKRRVPLRVPNYKGSASA